MSLCKYFVTKYTVLSSKTIKTQIYSPSFNLRDKTQAEPNSPFSIPL